MKSFQTKIKYGNDFTLYELKSDIYVFNFLFSFNLKEISHGVIHISAFNTTFVYIKRYPKFIIYILFLFLINKFLII